MPYVDIVSKDDYASLWYWTSTHNSNVGLFDPAKPTLAMLHPTGLDSSWMQRQAEDPRLYSSYNIILFDTRIAGRSQCRFSGKYDHWVSAADLAQAFYHLRLPPSHIFAPDHNSHVALRFATLFPSLCLSVTLCNLTPPTEPSTSTSVLEELNHLWSYAEDLETFEYACKEFLEYFGGPHAHPDLQDEVVAYWETYYPPFRRAFSAANMNVVMHRTALTKQELAAISSPVLIIQAESSVRCPIVHAEQLQHDLVNVPGGASLFRVKATAGYLSVVCASIVNQVLAKFLSRLSKADKQPYRLDGYKDSLQDFMGKALARLAELRDDPSFLKCDSRSPLSFSCTTPEVAKTQMQAIETFSQGQRKAFSPLGSDGRPLRKFSERQDHWLDAGRDGFSRSEVPRRAIDADPTASKKRPKNGDKKAQLQENSGRVTPPTPPLSDEYAASEMYQVARRRKNNAFSPSTVEKQTVKGPMAKVVVSSPTLRMIL